jgi:hypothetical protein
MSWLTKCLGITDESNVRVAEDAEKVKTVTEFLGDIAENFCENAAKIQEAAEKLPNEAWLGSAIESVLPWAEQITDVIGDAVPPVKAVLSLAQLFTREPDPNALGLLACPLAYQVSLAEAIKQIEADPNLRTRIGRPVQIREVRAALAKEAPENPEEFAGFRFTSMLSHPLVRRADTALRKVAGAAVIPRISSGCSWRESTNAWPKNFG